MITSSGLTLSHARYELHTPVAAPLQLGGRLLTEDAAHTSSRPEGFEERRKPLARFDELLFSGIRRALGVVRGKGDQPLEVERARLVVLHLLVFTNDHATMRLFGELEHFGGPLRRPRGHIALPPCVFRRLLEEEHRIVLWGRHVCPTHTPLNEGAIPVGVERLRSLHEVVVPVVTWV